MLHRELVHVRILFKRMLIVLALFLLCRILFWAFNYELFPRIDTWEFLKAMLFGLRYDISAVLLINSPFILMHVWPSVWRQKSWYQQVMKWLYYLVNGTFLSIEAGDFIYYEFAQERTSTHILGLRNDLLGLIPQFILDFWYVLLIGIILFMAIDILYKRTHAEVVNIRYALSYPMQTGLAFLILAITIIGVRGGLQSEVLAPQHAASVVKPNEIGLVTNTTFTILYALANRTMEEVSYLTREEADSVFHPTITVEPLPWSGKRPNVMVLVMESFSREYLGYYHPTQPYTPFLDSILKESLVYYRSIANGKHSIDVMPSITMALPPLMTDAFISSKYMNAPFDGLGTQLQSVGYHSYFFHGGNNGTLQLDQFIHRSGFDGYFGRNEFGDDTHFDGNWGIFDAPFLQFVARALDTLPQPFCNIYFSLSSHHPFTLPPAYATAYPEEWTPMMKSIAYSDEALRQFFTVAGQSEWFSNTVFIITADHTGPIFLDGYKTRLGHFAIPIAIYDPSGRLPQRQISQELAQQTDLLPTILSIAGYEGKVFGFGNNLLLPAKEPRFAINYLAGVYQYMEGDFMLHYDGQRVVGYYNYALDPLLENDLSLQPDDRFHRMLRRTQAIIQQFNHAILTGKMLPA